MKKGLLIILSGPSGVGKGATREKIMANNDLKLFYSISMTTREKRPGEVDGKDYFFVSKEEFERNVKNGNLLEHNTFVGNSYGTPKDKVFELMEQGKNVLLEIDVNGAMQVFEKLGHDLPVSIFLMPPSLKELEDRIRGRSTETEKAIEERLNRARKEIKEKDNYKYVVVNDKLDETVRQIHEIIENEIKYSS
ncbi:MAG: guanylate kinase [Bacilli bacterium]|nr:guanylate kinase [Bacilli bacterium]